MISIAAHQIGGDTEKLDSLIRSGRGNLNCRVDAFSPCAAFMESLIDYTTSQQGFVGQIVEAEQTLAAMQGFRFKLEEDLLFCRRYSRLCLARLTERMASRIPYHLLGAKLPSR